MPPFAFSADQTSIAKKQLFLMFFSLLLFNLGAILLRLLPARQYPFFVAMLQ
jgi:hypothetical protein